MMDFAECLSGFDLDFLEEEPANQTSESLTQSAIARRKGIARLKEKIINISQVVLKAKHTADVLYGLQTDMQELKLELEETKNLLFEKNEEHKVICNERNRYFDQATKYSNELQDAKERLKVLDEKEYEITLKDKTIDGYIKQLEALKAEMDRITDNKKQNNKGSNEARVNKEANLIEKKLIKVLTTYVSPNKRDKFLHGLFKMYIFPKRGDDEEKCIRGDYSCDSPLRSDPEEYENIKKAKLPVAPVKIIADSSKTIKPLISSALPNISIDVDNLGSVDTGRGSSLAFSDGEKSFYSPDYYMNDSPINNLNLCYRCNVPKKDVSTSPNSYDRIITKRDSCTSPLPTEKLNVATDTTDISSKKDVFTSTMRTKMRNVATDTTCISSKRDAFPMHIKKHDVATDTTDISSKKDVFTSTMRLKRRNVATDTTCISSKRDVFTSPVRTKRHNVATDTTDTTFSVFTLNKKDACISTKHTERFNVATDTADIENLTQREVVDAYTSTDKQQIGTISVCDSCLNSKMSMSVIEIPDHVNDCNETTTTCLEIPNYESPTTPVKLRDKLTPFRDDAINMFNREKAAGSLMANIIYDSDESQTTHNNLKSPKSGTTPDKLRDWVITNNNDEFVTNGVDIIDRASNDFMSSQIDDPTSNLISHPSPTTPEKLLDKALSNIDTEINLRSSVLNIPNNATFGSIYQSPTPPVKLNDKMISNTDEENLVEVYIPVDDTTSFESDDDVEAAIDCMSISSHEQDQPLTNHLGSNINSEMNTEVRLSPNLPETYNETSTNNYTIFYEDIPAYSTKPLKHTRTSESHMSESPQQVKKCLESNNSKKLKCATATNSEIQTILSKMRLRHRLITPIPATPPRLLRKSMRLSKDITNIDISLIAGDVNERINLVRNNLKNAFEPLLNIPNFLERLTGTIGSESNQALFRSLLSAEKTCTIRDNTQVQAVSQPSENFISLPSTDENNENASDDNDAMVLEDIELEDIGQLTKHNNNYKKDETCKQHKDLFVTAVNDSDTHLIDNTQVQAVSQSSENFISLPSTDENNENASNDNDAMVLEDIELEDIDQLTKNNNNYKKDDTCKQHKDLFDTAVNDSDTHLIVDSVASVHKQISTVELNQSTHVESLYRKSAGSSSNNEADMPEKHLKSNDQLLLFGKSNNSNNDHIFEDSLNNAHTKKVRKLTKLEKLRMKLVPKSKIRSEIPIRKKPRFKPKPIKIFNIPTKVTQVTPKEADTSASLNEESVYQKAVQVMAASKVITSSKVPRIVVEDCKITMKTTPYFQRTSKGIEEKVDETQFNTDNTKKIKRSLLNEFEAVTPNVQKITALANNSIADKISLPVKRKRSNGNEDAAQITNVNNSSLSPQHIKNNKKKKVTNSASPKAEENLITLMDLGLQQDLFTVTERTRSRRISSATSSSKTSLDNTYSINKSPDYKNNVKSINSEKNIRESGDGSLLCLKSPIDGTGDIETSVNKAVEIRRRISQLNSLEKSNDSVIGVNETTHKLINKKNQAPTDHQSNAKGTKRILRSSNAKEIGTDSHIEYDKITLDVIQPEPEKIRRRSQRNSDSDGIISTTSSPTKSQISTDSQIDRDKAFNVTPPKPDTIRRRSQKKSDSDCIIGTTSTRTKSQISTDIQIDRDKAFKVTPPKPDTVRRRSQRNSDSDGIISTTSTPTNSQISTDNQVDHDKAFNVTPSKPDTVRRRSQRNSDSDGIISTTSTPTKSQIFTDSQVDYDKALNVTPPKPDTIRRRSQKNSDSDGIIVTTSSPTKSQTSTDSQVKPDTIRRRSQRNSDSDGIIGTTSTPTKSQISTESQVDHDKAFNVTPPKPNTIRRRLQKKSDSDGIIGTTSTPTKSQISTESQVDHDKAFNATPPKPNTIRRRSQRNSDSDGIIGTTSTPTKSQISTESQVDHDKAFNVTPPKPNTIRRRSQRNSDSDGIIGTTSIPTKSQISTDSQVDHDKAFNVTPPKSDTASRRLQRNSDNSDVIMSTTSTPTKSQICTGSQIDHEKITSNVTQPIPDITRRRLRRNSDSTDVLINTTSAPTKSDTHYDVVSYNDLNMFSNQEDYPQETRLQNRTTDKQMSVDCYSNNILCRSIEKYGRVKIKYIAKKVSEPKVKEINDILESGISRILESRPEVRTGQMKRLVAEIKTLDVNLFLMGFVDFLRNPVRNCELISKKVCPPAPAMTNVEQVLLYVIDELQHCSDYRFIVKKILVNIEYALFAINKSGEAFGVIEVMSHFYALLCRSYQKFSQLRLFILDAMYCLQFKSITLTRQCLEVWMSALPLAHMGIAKTPLISCMVYLLHFYKCEDRKERVQDIRFILKMKYSYDFNDWNETKILELFKTAITELKDISLDKKMLRLALIILGKRNGPKWCQNNIVKKLLKPIIENGSSSIVAKLFCISILGPLLRPYPNNMKVHCEMITDYLLDMLKHTYCLRTQEAILTSLVLLHKQNNRVLEFLLKWNPKKISPEFELVLKDFVRTKTIKTWRAVLSQIDL